MNKQESESGYSAKEEFVEIEKASEFIVRNKPTRRRSILDDDSYEPREISYKAAFYCVYPKAEQYKIIKRSQDDKSIEDTELSRIVDDFFRGVNLNYGAEKKYYLRIGEIMVRSKRVLFSQELESLRKNLAVFNYSCRKIDITNLFEKESS